MSETNEEQSKRTGNPETAKIHRKPLRLFNFIRRGIFGENRFFTSLCSTSSVHFSDVSSIEGDFLPLSRGSTKSACSKSHIVTHDVLKHLSFSVQLRRSYIDSSITASSSQWPNVFSFSDVVASSSSLLPSRPSFFFLFSIVLLCGRSDI